MANHLDLAPNSKLRTPNCRLLTTPEQIVREYRLGSRGIQLHYAKEKTSTLEWVIRFFLVGVACWLGGYLHHFLITPR